MPGALARNGLQPAGGEFVVVGSGAQGGPQVALGTGEQAVADLPVGREPDPVAGRRPQAAQKGSVTEAMMPTVSGPPSTRKVSAGALPRPGTGVSTCAADRRVRVSAAVTIWLRSQPCWASSGICSMMRSW